MSYHRFRADIFNQKDLIERAKRQMGKAHRDIKKLLECFRNFLVVARKKQFRTFFDTVVSGNIFSGRPDIPGGDCTIWGSRVATKKGGSS
jgi:hypothetical protein